MTDINPEIQAFFGHISEVNERERRKHPVQKISVWYPCRSVLKLSVNFISWAVLQWGGLGRLFLVSWVFWFLAGFGQWETLERNWVEESWGRTQDISFFPSSTSDSVSGSSYTSSVAPVLPSLPLLPQSQLLGGLRYGSSPCWRAFASTFRDQLSCCVCSCRVNSLSAGAILWVASSPIWPLNFYYWVTNYLY